jgi:signal transduction histidine kinase
MRAHYFIQNKMITRVGHILHYILIEPRVAWPLIVVESVIVISCFLISFFLWKFTKGLEPLRFSLPVKALAYLIFICGVVQLVDLISTWQTLDALSVFTKICFGLIGAATALVSFRSFIRAVTIPGPQELKKNNLELVRLNKELNETCEAAQIGSWILDLEANKVLWSDWVYRIHEVDKGTEILFETAINFYHPDSRTTIKEAVEKAIVNGESWDLELKLLTAKGNIVWTRAIGRAVIRDGKTVKLKGLFQNINEKKLRVQKIEENEKRLEESQAIGQFGNWSLDLRNNQSIWSDKLYEIFGQNDNSTRPAIEELNNLIPLSDKIRLDDAIKAAINLKKDYDQIYRIVWRNGETKYLHERGQVFYNQETGKPERIAGTTQDVTTSALIEKELKESELALRDAEKISNTGIWKWLQFSDRHIWSDQRFRILGYEPGEIEPSLEASFELIIAEERELIKKQVLEATTKNLDYDLEYTINTIKGERKHMRERGRFHEEGGLQESVYIGTIQDVTDEIKRKEELERSLIALKRSNSELQNFAYVAHDLLEPLRVINSYLQLIVLSYTEVFDDEGKQYIRSTMNAAARMKALINDHLKLSRLEIEEIINQDVGLMDLMADVREDFKFVIDESSAEIVCKELPVVVGDRSQLKQLFQNLISNGVKFRKKGVAPVINISFETIDNYYQFHIKDNGIGIDKEHHDRIFTIFQRLHTREEYLGTGIGLAICKKIIDRHHGSISVKSVVGHGSTFSFTLKMITP